jgi:hypothetical protein
MATMPWWVQWQQQNYDILGDFVHGCVVWPGLLVSHLLHYTMAPISGDDIS